MPSTEKDINVLVPLGLTDVQTADDANIQIDNTLDLDQFQGHPPNPFQSLQHNPVNGSYSWHPDPSTFGDRGDRPSPHALFDVPYTAPSGPSTINPASSPAMTPATSTLSHDPENPHPAKEDNPLLTNLREALNHQTRQATFTCGGTLPIYLRDGTRVESGELTPVMEESFGGSRLMARGVGVRWGGGGEGSELTLPIVNEEEGERLRELVEECRPATFGRGGKDVLDESYRRAGAMGVKDFMTDFCPYSAGIIPIVEQYLLPSISGDLKPIPSRPKIAARYNLTNSQTTHIIRAVERYTRNKGDFVVSDDIGRFFQALDIVPESLAERTELYNRLNKFGSGFTEREELIDEAARRIAMKPPAPPLSAAANHPTPTVELGGNDENRRMLSRGIRAELYKLNVYSGPSGHFKPHVDTPRSDMQIGSLVVCLPVEFTGGALAIRHQGREVVYKWGQHKPAIRWAAFYSDCEHEVFEVDSGHRITLTYNLYLAPGTGLLAGVPKPLDVPSLPLFGQLKRLLADPAFLPKGGYLGIHLAHNYPHTHDKLHHFVPSMLKGSDMALYETLTHLGLYFILDPIATGDLPSLTALDTLEDLAINPDSTANNSTSFASNLTPLNIDTNLDEHALDYESQDNQHPGSFTDFLHRGNDWRYYGPQDSDDEDWPDRLPREWKVLKAHMDLRERITWLNGEGSRELSKVSVTYGNEATLMVGYSSVAMIVKVPKYRARVADGTKHAQTRAGAGAMGM